MNKTICALAAATLATGAAASEPIAVTAPGPQGDLAGTLIEPAEGKPVVLIVPGSGPTDREGNNPMGVNASSYRLLAEALSQRGIGSLRIDKRGMFESRAAIPDPNDVTISAYAEDVSAWISVVRARTEVDCVFVLGHSEGGLVALEAGQKSDDLCGILLVASVGRPLGDTLREQLQSNPANAVVLEEAFSAIGKLEAGERVDTQNMHRGLMPLFNPAVQGFLIDMFARIPAELAAGVEVPMLIVAGGKDIQTPVTDAEALAEGQPAAKLIVIDDMNHVLKPVEGDSRLANIATYSDASLPVHPELVDAIASFLEDPES